MLDYDSILLSLMKSGVAIVTNGIGLMSTINPTFAYDNGPKVVGFYYRSNASEKLKADSCFIPSSGMQMGQSWLIVRPSISNLYYRFEDKNEAKKIDPKGGKQLRFKQVQTMIVQ